MVGLARLSAGVTFAGRYRILRLLGHGGMASVYEAAHVATEMRVALKVLHPHIVEIASARRSFELEAKVAVRIQSSHVARVLDAGVEEGSGTPFLTMELLEGKTVAQHVEERGPLPVHTVLSWLGQVAEALDAAHGVRDEQGQPRPIVHRDLKPENLFVHEPAGHEPELKVLDFGIAKVATHTAPTSQEIRGTPLFISYEQLTARRVTPAADVWAFGLIAFYLLTGKHYWLSPAAGGPAEALYAEIVTLPLEAPSERLTKLGLSGSVPKAFDDWFSKAVNRDPEARFESVGSAQRALVAALAAGFRLLGAAPSAPTSLLPDGTLSSPLVAPPPLGHAPTVLSAPPPDTSATPSLAASSESYPAVESTPQRPRSRFALAGLVAVPALLVVGFWASRATRSPSADSLSQGAQPVISSVVVATSPPPSPSTSAAAAPSSVEALAPSAAAPLSASAAARPTPPAPARPLGLAAALKAGVSTTPSQTVSAPPRQGAPVANPGSKPRDAFDVY